MRLLHQNQLLLIGTLCFIASVSAAELKDPTRPPDFLEMTMDEVDEPIDTDKPWVLNSTIISPTHLLAVINGRLLGKGDSVGNMTVLEIKADKALLSVNNERVVVSLVPASIKTEAKQIGEK